MVAPLNWGLGHATRCIPIIKALLQHDFDVLIASDGMALALLRQEFPHLDHVVLPGYDIHYSKKRQNLRLELIKQAPKIVRAIMREKAMIEKLLTQDRIDGIISDNRFGVRHKAIPCVFMTHQIRVLSGWTTSITTFVQRQIIRKFDECWVPDQSYSDNMSGVMSHGITSGIPTKYVGILSRMTKQCVPATYDLLLLLSGPEPQRSLFEQKLISSLRDSTKQILMVRGIVSSHVTKQKFGAIEAVNYLPTHALEKVINATKLIVCRSGYSSIMDLAALGKKAFLVPTPGQYEQEYLAQKFKDEQKAPFCRQEDFIASMLSESDRYKGLGYSNRGEDHFNDWSLLFGIFQGK